MPENGEKSFSGSCILVPGSRVEGPGMERMATEDRANPTSFARYRSYLRFLAEGALAEKLRRRLDASDIVQEALLRAHVAAEEDGDRVRRQTGPERIAWLRQILANTLANALRDHQRARRDVRRERSLEEAFDQSSNHLVDFLAADQSTPSEKAIREEEILRLTDAMERLPEAEAKRSDCSASRVLPSAKWASA